MLEMPMQNLNEYVNDTMREDPGLNLDHSNT